MANKDKSIVWSVKHRPPLTVSMITAAILILQSSKGMLIDNLPVSNKELIAALSGWYTYLLDATGALFGLACIFLGVQKNEGSSYQSVADNINPDKFGKN